MRLSIEIALGLIAGLAVGAAAARLLFPSYFEVSVDWFTDLGMYWHEEHPPGYHGEGKHCADRWGCGYWAQRWWAPSHLWRTRWCFLGLHWWMVSGSGGPRDYWREGYWWRRPMDASHRAPADAYRWCARCSTRKGSYRYDRPADVRLGCCPGCGITDAFLPQYGHLKACTGDDRVSA